MTKYVVVNVEPCPAMTDEAIEGWEEAYQLVPLELKVWMGQMIQYCERQERRLGD